MSNETEIANPHTETAQTTHQFLETEKLHYEAHPPVVQENSCILKMEINGAGDEAAVPEATLVESEEQVEADTATTEPQVNGVDLSEPETVSTSTTAAPEQETTASQVEEVDFKVPLVQEEACILKSPEPEPRTPANSEASENGVDANGHTDNDKEQVLNEVVANELEAENYKLPDVSEVKKTFLNQPAAQNGRQATAPKKGTLSTTLDTQNVKSAYLDVRQDATETQWAVYKFEGPTIVTSSTGSDFNEFKKQFGEDERAFGYIRVQTGDEISRRAKFLLVTWVGPMVSVLKRAKMSTDKALIKGVVSNFAVELQTENIADINLQKFETELDKAAGAHYGTGIRS